MTGRSGEVVEVLVRRRVEICCVQETRWKGSGVRMVKGRQGQKYKFVWQGCPEGVHGVDVLFSEEFVDSVVSMTRVSETWTMVKMMIGKLLVNVISEYAPQVGRSDEEKDEFWCAIEKLMENVKDEEVVVVGGHLNGHVFLHRQRVLQLYRSLMRTLRYLPDEADRVYMAGWVREEFVKHKDEKDVEVLRMLMNRGHDQLSKFQRIVNLAK
uniref:LYR motif-containing protein 2 n=1 Tax=Myxine glutinosa TaxID=7769 RepID=UPI00358DF666